MGIVIAIIVSSGFISAGIVISVWLYSKRPVSENKIEVIFPAEVMINTKQEVQKNEELEYYKKIAEDYYKDLDKADEKKSEKELEEEFASITEVAENLMSDILGEKEAKR